MCDLLRNEHNTGKNRTSVRASLNTSDYLRNWESSKIAPLEQCSGDPYLPHGTTVPDNMRTEDSSSRLLSYRGDGGGGRWHIGTWDTSGQQLTTMQLIMPPIVLSVGGSG